MYIYACIYTLYTCKLP